MPLFVLQELKPRGTVIVYISEMQNTYVTHFDLVAERKTI